MSRPARAPETGAIVFVRCECGDVFHWSNNAPAAVAEALDGARSWLRYVRSPNYKGRKPCGRAEVVCEPLTTP